MDLNAETEALEATVRPTDDAPPAYDGVHVFRWFDIADADWHNFRDMSDTAWPNMEEVFDVNFCGILAQLGDSATRNEGSAFDPICGSLRLGGVPLVEKPGRRSRCVDVPLPEAQRDDQAQQSLIRVC